MTGGAGRAVARRAVEATRRLAEPPAARGPGGAASGAVSAGARGACARARAVAPIAEGPRGAARLAPSDLARAAAQAPARPRVHLVRGRCGACAWRGTADGGAQAARRVPTSARLHAVKKAGGRARSARARAAGSANGAGHRTPALRTVEAFRRGRAARQSAR